MKRYYILAGLLAIPLAITAWGRFGATPSDGQISGSGFTAVIVNEPIQPIPLRTEIDRNKAVLGKTLFEDPRLSRDNTISCVSCHSLDQGGVDRRTFSIGVNSAVGAVNAPTVFNSGFNFKQFWDGRAATLEDQIDGPVQDASEMGSTWSEVIAKLRAAPDYPAAFNSIYADGINAGNIKDAIAAFERSLSTPNARFDRYLRGDDGALTNAEKQGYQIFKSYGCASCHQGVNIGGNMFQTFGVMADYFADRGNITRADLGRLNVTGDPNDRYVFKVPSLRNVALTAPYFHDGSMTRLEDAVEVMGEYQLGRHLSRDEVALLVSFLNTLTGERETE